MDEYAASTSAAIRSERQRVTEDGTKRGDKSHVPLKKLLIRKWSIPEDAVSRSTLLDAPSNEFPSYPVSGGSAILEQPSSECERPRSFHTKQSPDERESACYRSSTGLQPVIAPHAARRRRYPKLLTTDSKGHIIANPKRDEFTPQQPQPTSCHQMPRLEDIGSATTSSRRTKLSSQSALHTSERVEKHIRGKQSSHLCAIISERISSQIDDTQPICVDLRGRKPRCIPADFRAIRNSAKHRIDDVDLRSCMGRKIDETSARNDASPETGSCVPRNKDRVEDSHRRDVHDCKSDSVVVIREDGPSKPHDSIAVVKQNRKKTSRGAVSDDSKSPIGNADGAVQSDVSTGMDNRGEGIIQVGRRSGDVIYWRTSLQMPKITGRVTKSRPTNSEDATRRRLKGRKQTWPSGDNRLTPQSPIARKSKTHRSRRSSEGKDNGKGSVQSEKGTVGSLLQQNLAETSRLHEFWRKSTKLPSSNSNAAKSRHLRCATADRPQISQDGNEEAPAESRTHANNCSSADKNLHQHTGKLASPKAAPFRPRENADSVLARTEEGRVWPKQGYAHAYSRSEERGERKRRPLVTPQGVLNDAQFETWNLHEKKEYEFRKLDSLAQAKMEAKMNLRGKQKLQTWLSSSDSVSARSLRLIAHVNNLDQRLFSTDARERQDVLDSMENFYLRVLEALMTRLKTREGRANWTTMTANQ